MEKNEEHFRFSTIIDFDSHIARSILGYNCLFRSVTEIAANFMIDGCNIYDIGCSTGKLLKAIEPGVTGNINLIGIDREKNLLPENTPKISFHHTDINSNTLRFSNPSLVISMFTLNFLRLDQREPIINRIHDDLIKGGALILCDKIYCRNPLSQAIFENSNIAYKRIHFTDSLILDKIQALKGYMMPMYYDVLYQLLSNAGFSEIECFWKSGNFMGLLCIK